MPAYAHLTDALILVEFSTTDKTGLSPVNERDFNESPNLRLARKSIQKQGNVSDAGSVKGALMLSPILRDSPKNPQKSKVAGMILTVISNCALRKQCALHS